jgi:hypothetical protein
LQIVFIWCVFLESCWEHLYKNRSPKSIFIPWTENEIFLDILEGVFWQIYKSFKNGYYKRCKLKKKQHLNFIWIFFYRMLDYLCNKNCLSEQIESDSSSQSQVSAKNWLCIFCFLLFMNVANEIIDLLYPIN